MEKLMNPKSSCWKDRKTLKGNCQMAKMLDRQIDRYIHKKKNQINRQIDI